MADTSNCNVVSFRRRFMLSFASALLALAGLPAIAQTTVTNTATVTPPTGITNPGTSCPAPNFNATTGACSATDTDTVVFPQLTMLKTASVGAGAFTVGVPGSYTLQVQNTGTAATTAVATITDTIPASLTIGAMPAGCTVAGQTVTCTADAGLVPNAVASFTIPVTPTVAVAAPGLTNTATVGGGGDATCPTDTRCTSSVTNLVNAPQVTLTKTASAASFTVGVPASYTLQLSNTGTATTIGSITVTDTIPASLTIGTLPAGCSAAGQTVTCTFSVALSVGATSSVVIPVTPTVAVAAPGVTNTATASGGGDPTCPADTRCTSSVTTPVNAPQLFMTKTASAASFTVGVPASYTLNVQNTGTAATTAVATITDTVPASLTIGTLPAGCTAAGQTATCTIAAGLAAGGSTSFVIPVTPTVAVAAPGLTNTATVSGGGDPTCPADARCTSTVDTPVNAPQLFMTKTASAASFTVGVPASYTLNVQNTGTAATTAVATITDTIPTGLTIGTLPAGCTAAGQTVTCTIAAGLAAGGSTSFVIPVTPTASAAASITNTATVSGGGDPTCPATSRCSGSVTTSIDRPVINVAKTAGVATGPAADSTYTVTYSIAVANSGTAAGTYGALTDSPIFSANLDILGATWTTSGAGAPAGGSILGDGPYQLAGTNTAIGAGVTHTFNLSITYRFTNGTVPTVCAATPTPGSGLYNRAELPVGQEDGGTADNAACVNSPPPPAPALTLDKTASPTTVSAAGQAVAYSFLVTNTGNVTITALQINEIQFSGTGTAPLITCPVSALAPSASTTCTGTYVVTQQDIDTGSITNEATASGTNTIGGTTTSPTDTAAVTSTATPNVSVLKTGPASVDVDSSFQYTLTLANNGGSTTGTNLIVQDQLPAGMQATAATGATCTNLNVPGALLTCTVPGPIAPGGNAVVTLTVTAPPSTGFLPATETYTNYAATNPSGTGNPGTPPGAGCVNSATVSCSSVDTDVLSPFLQFSKLASAASFSIGVPASYTLQLNNSGSTATTAVATITDVVPSSLTLGTLPAGCTAAGQTVTCTIPAGLASGSTTSFIIPVTPTAAAVPQVTNTASVSGGGDPGCPAQGRCENGVTTPVDFTSTLTLDKTASPTTVSAVGQTVTYSFLVTNTGDVTVTGLQINETAFSGTGTAPAITCPVTTLAPGASTTCTATYAVTQQDIDAGSITNTATASGADPVGGTTTSPTDDAEVTVTATPTLTIAKTASTATYATVGQVVAYEYVVSNTGNVTINALSVTDDRIAAVSCPVTTLAPGASTTCTGSYTITQADLDSGSVTNVATANGTPTGGTLTPPTDTVTITAVADPSQTLTKALTNDSTGGAVVVGDVLTYTVTMTNTGNTTLSNVVVGDALITPNSLTCASVVPGATCQLVGTYTVTQADADAGTIRNTAMVTSPVCPLGSTDPACTTTIDTPVSVVVANDDNGTVDNGLTGGVAVPTVLVNDTLNGVAVTPATVAITVATGSTVPPQLTFDTGTGEVSVNPNTPAGTYTFDYTICEVLNPTNCDTATVTVTVGEAVIDAVDDTFPAINGGDGGTTPSVLVNDTLNGVAVDPAAVTLTPGASPNPGLAMNPDGTITVDAGTPAGTYLYPYTICEVINPTNCDAAVATVVVTAPAIDAVDDTPPPVDGENGGTTPSVLVNDTLNGAAVVPAEVILTPGTAPTPISGSLVMNPDGTITIAPGTTSGTYVYPYTICEVANPTNCDSANATIVIPVWENPAIAATKTATLTTDNGTPGVGNPGDVITYNVTVTNSGNVALSNLVVEDSFEGGTPTTLNCTPTTLAVGATATCASYTHTITAAEASVGGTLENVVIASAQSTTSTSTVTVTATSTAVVEVEAANTTLRITKVAGVREVKIGDLVRYTLSVENTGSSDLVGGSIVDTPPAGFTYVEGSLTVDDGDNMATVSGQSPIRFMGLDVAAGETATLVYTMRVGAGVRAGAHVNQAQAFSPDDEPISNVTTAEVTLVADAMIDESLLFGTVFDDRDSDGWQDSAAMTGVRVQGGFAPGAYVANSTTVDRGAGPQPEADASSPLLHGIDVGSISSRQSVADPVENHQVIIRQRLTELAFTNDFVLTSAQGVTVKMDAAGNTTVDKTGEAAKGLNAAEPTVERRVSQGEGGYVVDYVVRNLGIDERGIPGVRIASVEGLLIETDQFGRYHLAGVPGGAWERGRNFILKVDPSTLPAGSVFTTDNPLLRRITPGLPVRFDWGVKLPVEEIEGGTQQVEMELGEVIFTPGSAEVRAEYLPAIEKIAAKVVEYRGGDVVISANGHTESLAFERANAVKAAMLEKVPADIARNLTVSVRADPGDPESLVLGLGEGGYLLGKVLFDTDKSDIRPEFEPLLDTLAQALERLGGGDVAVIGHTDVRGSHAYNTALGLRRAKSVYDALAKRLSPEVRAKVRVDVSNDPTAPVGVKRK